MNRRGFLAKSSAAGAAALGYLAAPRLLGADAPGTKPRLRIVYALHAPQQPGPDWPNQGFDFQPVMDRITNELTRQCPEFEFVSSMATGEEAAKKLLEGDQGGGVNGYIVYQLNCWNRVVQTLATSGKPVLYADFQFGGSGGFLVYTAAFLRAKAPNVGFVASSKLEDLVAAVRCFSVVTRGGSVSEFVAATTRVRGQRTPGPGTQTCTADKVATLGPEDCLRRMRESRILAVRDQNSSSAPPIMGIPLDFVSFAEVNDAWKQADKDASAALADRWQTGATKVEGVSRETMVSSAAFYLGMKDVLKKRNANAITVNCLGGFYGGHIHAYPCLGFHQLLNDGLIGACECDIRSTATMVAMTALTQGRPGYISDPVIDTAKRQIIYAHCVAANRPFGPNGAANAYEILTHSEDRQGASVRSVLPVGYLTTTLEFDHNRKEVLFHQGKAVANDPDDRACRTKLCAEPVGDLEKLFTQWDQWGWHRVTYYGDLKAPVFALAEALGYKVVQEA